MVAHAQDKTASPEPFLPIESELRSYRYDFAYVQQALTLDMPVPLKARLRHAYKLLQPLQHKTYNTLTLGDCHEIHEAHFVIHHGLPRKDWYLSSALYPWDDHKTFPKHPLK
jgi:hypothetical protein